MLHRIRWFRLSALIVLAALAISPWWAPRVLQRVDYFQLRHVRVEGAVYADAAALIRTAGVSTAWSVWSDTRAAERRLRQHPLIATATIHRELPGTLVFLIHERRPLALISRANGLVAVDSTGRVLPLDLTRDSVDAPIVASADTTTLRFLHDLSSALPQFYGSISDVAPDGDGSLVVHADTLVLRAAPTAPVARLADVSLVLSDLERRHRSATHIDLRIPGQVVVRLRPTAAPTSH